MERLAPEPLVIPFTQYLLPDGQRRQIGIVRPQSVMCEAWIAIRRGVRFEAEMLRTGQISLTAESGDPDEPTVHAHEICANGPDVLAAVDRLVHQAYESVTTPTDG